MAKTRKLKEFVSLIDVDPETSYSPSIEVEQLANYAIAKVTAIGSENIYFITEDDKEVYVKQGDWHPAKIARLLLPLTNGDRLFNQAMDIWHENRIKYPC